MTSIEIANKIFALGTIAGQISIVAFVIYFFFFRSRQNAVTKFLHQNGLLLAFLVALSSVFGSLFYSQIAGFAPCELCWFQRVFMYPQVLLLGFALVKKDTRIIDY